jgi:hypothetical protein
LFLTLLDDVAAGTGATPLAMPDGDELDRCRRAHPGQVKGTGGDDDDDGSEQKVRRRGVSAPSCVSLRRMSREGRRWMSAPGDVSLAKVGEAQMADGEGGADDVRGW